MQYLIRLSDAAAQHMVILTLEEAAVKQPAIDIVFDIIGHSNPDELVRLNILAAGQIEDLKALQAIIFDHDAQGALIRDGINFKVNGRELDPDASMDASFVPAEREGVKYMRCDLVVEGGPQPAAKPAEQSAGDPVKSLSRVFFLHQIAAGPPVDVTKDYPELVEAIADAERRSWIEVDVQKAAYKLTPEGQRAHDSFMAEAQDLIRRFDIYCDVDVDSSGNARFDTGLGKDLRVPAYEMESVDPFRARFLLGLNDGEWDQLSNWYELFEDPDWYSQIFESIERAPSVDDIGRQRMASIMDQAKAALRQE